MIKIQREPFVLLQSRARDLYFDLCWLREYSFYPLPQIPNILLEVPVSRWIPFQHACIVLHLAPHGYADGSCGSGGLPGFLGGFQFSSKNQKLVNCALSGVGNQVTKQWRLKVVLYTYTSVVSGSGCCPWLCQACSGEWTCRGMTLSLRYTVHSHRINVRRKGIPLAFEHKVRE